MTQAMAPICAATTKQ